MYMPKSAVPMQQSPQPTAQPRTGYMPKTAVPVQPEKKSLGGFLKNIPKSLGNTIVDVAKSAVNVFNPNMDENTLYNIGKLATGVGQKFTPGIQKEEETANQVGQFYKDRYGGIENIKNTLYNDPVGAGLDVASVVSGVGAGVKGAGLVSKVPSLVKAGSTLSKVGSAIDPLVATGKVASKVVQPFKPLFNRVKPITPTKELTKLESIAKSRGVELPASAKTTNPFVRQAEALTAKGLFGGKVSKRIEGLREMPDEMLREATLKNTGEVADLKNSLGQSVKSDLGSFAKGFKEKASSIYDDIEIKLGNQSVKPIKTQQIIDKIYDQQRLSALPQGQSQKLLEQLFYNLEDSNTYSKLNQTRKDIGQLLNSTDPVASGQKSQLKAIYGAIQSDLDDVAKAGGDIAETLEVKGKMDAKWNEFRKLLNKQEGRQILSDTTDIEDIVPKIYRPNNASSIKRLKQFTSPETVRELGNTMLTEIVNSTVGRNGLIDPNKWKTIMQKWDRPTLVEAIGADGVKRLEEISKVVEDANFSRGQITEATKAFSGSQTAMLANTGIGAGTLTGSILTLNPVPILSYLGANALGAGVFNYMAKPLKSMKIPSGAKNLFSKAGSSSYLFGKAGRMATAGQTQTPRSAKEEGLNLSPETYPPIIQQSPYQVPQIRRSR